MFGCILGDIVGSVYEHKNHSPKIDFDLFSSNSRFTDDSVLSIATADALLQNYSFEEAYLKWGRKYPLAGYGENFMNWLSSSNPLPYNSFGNGSAMRVAPIGWFANTIDECLELAKQSAIVTHNHPEGIKGAQAVASAVYLAKNKLTKNEIKAFLTKEFQYELERSYAIVAKDYSFDVSCQGSVPEAIICFLESESTEDAIRKAVLLNGDTDTQACIAGGIAEAFFVDISRADKNTIKLFLKEDMNAILDSFESHVSSF